ARLFRETSEARAQLDRLLHLAPGFSSVGTAEEVAAAVCQAAVDTLGSDSAGLWTVDGDEVGLIRRVPDSPMFPPELRRPPRLAPDVRERVRRGRASYLPRGDDESAFGRLHRDAHNDATLLMPIVVDASVQSLLALGWQREVAEPTAANLAVARRFADQAGL